MALIPALVLVGTLIFVLLFAVFCYRSDNGARPVPQSYAVVPDHVMRHATIERFFAEMANEKPIRFTPGQLQGYTSNYSSRLGAGGFGTVYKGALPNGLAVAVKVLHGDHNQRSEEHFMAEMGTIGRTHHINLVRLFGFCFDASVRALVYEFMQHGALDAYLFNRAAGVGLATVAAITTGVARGLRYLHEECHQKIIHYDIKGGNVLLDRTLTPKVADFGLARLVDRADTHVSMSGVRGTPGYAAPELWMGSGVTEKCDVYSFGMLLFEAVGNKRNHEVHCRLSPLPPARRRLGPPSSSGQARRRPGPPSSTGQARRRPRSSFLLRPSSPPPRASFLLRPSAPPPPLLLLPSAKRRAITAGAPYVMRGCGPYRTPTATLSTDPRGATSRSWRSPPPAAMANTSAAGLALAPPPSPALPLQQLY
ncbi:rust resistance kinase Lr10-like [Triticum dicoccoides]|uniref:rust resistance kinase Lr10-like n=1 Tax=Triticum dicoccoides TaxID=85692 RepID=UPI00188FAA3E|nr:rust resistance kinase Lr10-like [Triticum dicoccoides]